MSMHRQIAQMMRKGASAPSLGVLDTFTDTNGTLLTAHTPDLAPVGASWEVFEGEDLIITDDRAVYSPSSVSALCYLAIESGASDAQVSVVTTYQRIGGENHYNGVIVRLVDASNYVYTQMEPASGELRIFEVISDEITSLAVVNTVHSGVFDLVEINITATVSGDQLRVEIPIEGIDETVTLSGPVGTKHGLRGGSSPANPAKLYFDNFEVLP